MSEYLTVGEAMKELKVCRNTLNKHIRSGRLMSYRVGRLVRITRSDLEDFIKLDKCFNIESVGPRKYALEKNNEQS